MISLRWCHADMETNIALTSKPQTIWRLSIVLVRAGFASLKYVEKFKSNLCAPPLSHPWNSRCHFHKWDSRPYCTSAQSRRGKQILCPRALCVRGGCDRCRKRGSLSFRLGLRQINCDITLRGNVEGGNLVSADDPNTIVAVLWNLKQTEVVVTNLFLNNSTILTDPERIHILIQQPRKTAQSLQVGTVGEHQLINAARCARLIQVCGLIHHSKGLR